MPESPPAADKSKAACDFITQTNKGLTTLSKSVCNNPDAAAPESTDPKPADTPPAAAALSNESIEAWIADKKSTNAFLEGATITEKTVGDEYEIAVGGKTFTLLSSAGTIDAQADAIAAALGPEGTTKMSGGRRGKRSARKGRKSSKGGRRSRKGKGKRKGKKSRRGGRRSRISRH